MRNGIAKAIIEYDHSIRIENKKEKIFNTSKTIDFKSNTWKPHGCTAQPNRDNRVETTLLLIFPGRGRGRAGSGPGLVINVEMWEFKRICDIKD